MTNLKEFKVGDKFFNTLTKKVATITFVEENHYYTGSRSFGNYYKLVYENGTKINLTPIMISNFKYIPND